MLGETSKGIAAGATRIHHGGHASPHAANVGLNTVDFRDNDIRGNVRTLSDWGDPMVTSLQGGIAIKHNGKVVGGIAMSGNSTIRDEALAAIGLEAMGVKE